MKIKFVFCTAKVKNDGNGFLNSFTLSNDSLYLCVWDSISKL